MSLKKLMSCAWQLPFLLESLHNSSTQKSTACNEHDCPKSTSAKQQVEAMLPTGQSHVAKLVNGSKPCCQPVKAMLQNWSTGQSHAPKHKSSQS